MAIEKEACPRCKSSLIEEEEIKVFGLKGAKRKRCPNQECLVKSTMERINRLPKKEKV